MPKEPRRTTSILVVDEDCEVAAGFSRVLSPSGMTIHGTGAVAEARRLLDCERPDLVVLDPEVQDVAALIEDISRRRPPPQILVFAWPIGAAIDWEARTVEISRLGAAPTRVKADQVVPKTAPLGALLEAIESLSGRSLESHAEYSPAVLVVDDDPLVRESLRARLESQQFRVYIARHGSEAVQVVGAHPEIRLALIDVVLPDQSGIDILRQIVDRSPHPDVIMMSCDWKRELLEEVAHLGVTNCLQKPISPTGLDTALRIGLGQSPSAGRWWRHAS